MRLAILGAIHLSILSADPQNLWNDKFLNSIRLILSGQADLSLRKNFRSHIEVLVLNQ